MRPRNASCRTSSSPRPAPTGRRWPSSARPIGRTKSPTKTASPPSGVLLKLHPRLAPIKAAVFPLVKKDGMPEIAQEIYRALKPHIQRLLRREGGGGPPLSPPGRGGHAVLRYCRRRDAQRRHGDDPRPRFAQAMADEEGGCCRGGASGCGRTENISAGLPPLLIVSDSG